MFVAATAHKKDQRMLLHQHSWWAVVVFLFAALRMRISDFSVEIKNLPCGISSLQRTREKNSYSYSYFSPCGRVEF